MKLEIEKRYHIKPKTGGQRLKEGDYIIAFSNDDWFKIVTDDCSIALSSISVDCYDFTRLPSFGDEVEVWKGKEKNTDWDFCYYVHENHEYYFIGYSSQTNVFNNLIKVDAIVKGVFTIRLKPQPKENPKKKALREIVRLLADDDTSLGDAIELLEDIAKKALGEE